MQPHHMHLAARFQLVLGSRPDWRTPAVSHVVRLCSNMFGFTRLCSVQFGPIQFYSVLFCSVFFGSVRFCTVRSCSELCSASHRHSDACPDCEQPKFMYSNYINDTGHAHLFEESTSFVHLVKASHFVVAFCSRFVFVPRTCFRTILLAMAFELFWCSECSPESVAVDLARTQKAGELRPNCLRQTVRDEVRRSRRHATSIVWNPYYGSTSTVYQINFK